MRQPDLAVPGIPSIRFRHFKGPEDFHAIITVREACREQDQVDVSSARESIPTVASLAHTYGAVETGSPDWLFVEVAEAVVGYAQVSWWAESGPLEVYLQRGWVVPHWRGRGIGQRLLNWSERRSREAHAGRAPDHAATFAANCSSTQPDAHRLLERAGYRVVHAVSDMARHGLDRLPKDSPLPAGLTIRLAHIADARCIYEAYKDAWQGLWGETPVSEADYRDFLSDNVYTPLFDASLWQVAWDGEDVAGFVIAALDGDVGKFPEVAVRKRWQRREVGTALMTRAMRLLRERRASQLRLFTNAENPVGAKTMYERLGFREVKRHDFLRKPF